MFRVLPSPLALLIALGLLIGVPLAGCVASSVRGEREAAPRDGLDGYRLVADEARSLAGCRYDYRVYEPAAAPAAGAPVTVMLGHGFLRDQDTLVELARALANDGHRAVTLDFCNMRPWNGHHERNAADLRALAERVAGGRPVVYAGFSAGALAAVLAASADPATLGVVTLDLVDMNDLARDALATLAAPLVGLQGPPSACNAGGSGQRTFEVRPDAALETLAGASHCEFESPTNWLCELACGDDDAAADDERVRADIVRRVTGAVRELAGGRGGDVDPRLSLSRS